MLLFIDSHSLQLFLSMSYFFKRDMHSSFIVNNLRRKGLFLFSVDPSSFCSSALFSCVSDL